MYSNCCCSCSFEPEIIKIGQSSHKMYSNNILNFQESTTIFNACTKKVWKLIECTMYFLFFHLLQICRPLFVSFYHPINPTYSDYKKNMNLTLSIPLFMSSKIFCTSETFTLFIQKWHTSTCPKYPTEEMSATKFYRNVIHSPFRYK